MRGHRGKGRGWQLGLPSTNAQLCRKLKLEIASDWAEPGVGPDQILVRSRRNRPRAGASGAFAVAPPGTCFRLALAMPRLRLLTFNIAHGRGLNPIQGLTSAQKLKNNLRKIAKLIERLQPDIVALQEIDECSRWAGNFDHLDYLRMHAGFPHAVFGINTRRKGLLNLCYQGSQDAQQMHR